MSTEDEEFADYFDVCEAVEDGEIQNQAANLSDMPTDPRTFIEGDALKDEFHRNVGQLMIKFAANEDAEGGKAGMRAASGVVIKELGDDRYVVMTSCYPFVYSADGQAEIIDGQFFLQRNGAKGFAARFKLDVENVVTYDQFELGESSAAEGKDIALCVIEYVSGDKEALDDIDAVKPSSKADYEGDEKAFRVGGYPHQTIKEGAGLCKSQYFHFSKEGKIQEMKELDGEDHGVLLHSTGDCSIGQNGAPLYVTSDDGERFIGAVHSGASQFTDAKAGDDKYYTGTVITKQLYDNFILPTIQGFN